MNSAELAILLAEGEGTTLEYKQSLSASLARELVALANTVGGKILLGVRDDRTVAGIEDSNELRARIQDIARNCDPPVRVQVQPVGEVIVVTVRESDAKPVQCSDGFFWRKGSTTPEPAFEASGFFTATFFPNPEVRARAVAQQVAGGPGPQLGTKSGPSRDQVLILRECSAERTLAELLQFAGRTSRTKFRDQAIRPLLEAGWLAMNVPDKPKSSKQRYRTTAQGLQVLVATARTSTAQAAGKSSTSTGYARERVSAPDPDGAAVRRRRWPSPALRAGIPRSLAGHRLAGADPS